MGGDHLHVLYNRHMERYGLGHALFEPESSHELKPGACGYLDDHGAWRPLLDLTDKAAVEALGYTGIEESLLAGARPAQYHWGPKSTDTVSYTKANIKAGASGLPAGIPAEASVLIEFRLKEEETFGAVLLCTQEVYKTGYHHVNPFRQWALANAERLLKAFPDIDKHGFHIVTTSYATTDVYINSWTKKSNRVVLGFKAGLTPAGEIAPNAESYRAQTMSDWNHPICQGNPPVVYPAVKFWVTDNSLGDEKKVVFFSGLLFKFHKYTGWLRKVSPPRPLE